jgi:hypothetical protein
MPIALWKSLSVRSNGVWLTLFPKRRIGKDHFVFAMIRGERVLDQDRYLRVRISADAMQQQIHGAEASETVHKLDATELLRIQVTELRLIEPFVGDFSAADAAFVVRSSSPACPRCTMSP